MRHIDARHYLDMMRAAHDSITKLAYPGLRMGRKYYTSPYSPPHYGPYSPKTVLKNCMLCPNERRFDASSRYVFTGIDMMR
jgi:hypothetical protein